VRRQAGTEVRLNAWCEAGRVHLNVLNEGEAVQPAEAAPLLEAEVFR
jgi:hypothetical protein